MKNFEFSGLELFLAMLEKLGAFLVMFDHIFEGEFAFFHNFDEGREAFEAFFEGEIRFFRMVHNEFEIEEIEMGICRLI